MRRVLLLAFLAAPGLPAWGARLPTADFLNLPVDARSIGMAEAAQASADGPAGVPVNPAAINGVAAHEFYFTHGFWVADVGFDYLGYGMALGPHRLGLSYHHVGYGTLDGRDNAGNATGNFGPSDTAYGLTYGVNVGPAEAGVTVKHIQSKIVATAQTWTFDVGARLAPVDDLTLAIAGTNLAGGLRYEQLEDPLPRAIKGGLAWTPLPDWILALDVVGPLYTPAFMAIGTEYGYSIEKAGTALFRLGFNTKTPELGGFTGLKAGFGFAFSAVQIDYAFSPFGDLGDTHHLGLTYRFGKPREAGGGGRSYRTREDQDEAPAREAAAPAPLPRMEGDAGGLLEQPMGQGAVEEGGSKTAQPKRRRRRGRKASAAKPEGMAGGAVTAP